ncbi:hypothetical protein TNCV_1326011 [Trichonephila clavipes]|nr:hypothetical protein TNCV_1326011 [Trichonephila clavipes]
MRPKVTGKPKWLWSRTRGRSVVGSSSLALEYTLSSRPTGIVISDGDCAAVGPGVNGSRSNGLLTESPRCSKRRRTIRADTCCFANDPNSRLRAREVAARSIKAMWVTCLSSRLLMIRGPMRSRVAFLIIVPIPSIPYSANSHWISTDSRSNTAIR